MIKRLIGGLIAVGLAIGLAACGSNHSAPLASQKVTTLTVINELQLAGLPTTQVVFYTAANDPNRTSIVGLAKGYAGAADWVDSRAEPVGADDDHGVDNGGAVEVFTSNGAARDRLNYVQRVLKAIPALGTEHDYLAGPVLLRISGTLSATQAAAYAAVISARPVAS